jgi:hypothetical protein
VADSDDDAVLLAALRRDWGHEYQINQDADGTWVAIRPAGASTLRAESAAGLDATIAADQCREATELDRSAWAQMGPGERVLRQLAEDGII